MIDTWSADEGTDQAGRECEPPLFPPTMMEIGALAFIGAAAYEQERTLDVIAASYDLFRVLRAGTCRLGGVPCVQRNRCRVRKCRYGAPMAEAVAPIRLDGRVPPPSRERAPIGRR